MSNNFIDEIKKVKPKIRRVSYSIDETVLDEFGKIANERGYNRSKIIENFLKKFIEAEKK